MIVGAAALVMLGLERWFPRRSWPQRSYWWLRASLAIGVQAVVAYVGAVTWDVVLPRFALWQAADLGVVAGGLVGYVVLTFVYYWWHRARHSSDFLWRLFHQTHHSPARLELASTFYKHPIEILVNGLLSSLALALVVGATPAQSILAITLTGVAELFYHWNVRTPYWVGFVIQRPESHCVHHARDRHDCNFADLPLWDMLFGTFHNPRVDRTVCGFEEADERRWLDLLLARPLGRRSTRDAR
jgi:sterol desaturase/sphingolipid hydroxylase (fatty acid hydroxylase superfamily)